MMMSVLQTDVAINSGNPAAKVGLKSCNIIIGADDKEVTNLAYLRYVFYNYSVGDTMKLKVMCGTETMEVTITLDQKAS